LIYFFLYFFIETIVSVEVFSLLGGIGAFLEIVSSALLGIFLLINFRYTLKESIEALLERRITHERFNQVNFLSIMGAFMLILPGVFSDILGILFQFSVVTTFIVSRFMKPKKDYDDSVIDVEIIETYEKKE
jgi:2-isopropylmalate synthase/UPF0716 protein FxsA